MKTAIMGFGNPVRSDDAVGIYVIEQLREKLPDSDDISIIDMGTAAFEVLATCRVRGSTRSPPARTRTLGFGSGSPKRSVENSKLRLIPSVNARTPAVHAASQPARSCC